MKILEIRLLEFLFKIRFRMKIELYQILKSRIFFQKWKTMILKRLRQSFGFEIKSNTDSNESGRFLLALLNLKQYISTKINP
jgi:hypothetical protein